jgi:NADPH:quinone reductase-like Zn-dependent oxidoreductase
MDPPLSLPWEEKESEWPILLWGGATQVGIQAIQLAKLAGCSPIIVPASKKVSCNKSPLRSILHLLVWETRN